MAAVPDTLGSLFVFVVSSLIVILDGQLIRVKGRTYLRAVLPDTEAAESINLLIDVLFHLLTLGVLALLMAAPIPSAPMPAFETKLGVALLIVGVAHAAAILTLGRVRARHEANLLLESRQARDPSARGDTAVPATRQAGSHDRAVSGRMASTEAP